MDLSISSTASSRPASCLSPPPHGGYRPSPWFSSAYVPVSKRTLDAAQPSLCMAPPCESQDSFLTQLRRFLTPCHLLQGSVPPCRKHRPNNPDTIPTGNVTLMLICTSALTSLSTEMQFAISSNLHTMAPSRSTAGIPNSSKSFSQPANHRSSQ